MPFPYPPRPFQRQLMESVQHCLRHGKHLVMQAATGSGKTIGVLYPAVRYAKQNGMRILYVTRTNSQQRQAIRELQAMQEDITAVGFQGRTNMCLLAEENPDFRTGSAGEISRLCSTRKKRTIRALRGEGKLKNGCPYFASFYRLSELPAAITGEKILSAEEVVQRCRDKHLCPYEVNKQLVKKATVVIAPYVYLFDAALREKLVEWGFTSFDRSILVVDEAHNLPQYCRDILSPRLSVYMLTMAMEETREYLEDNEEIMTFCTLMRDLIDELKRDYIVRVEEGTDTDGFIPPGKLAAAVRRCGWGRADIERFSQRFLEYGELILEAKEKRDILPRSYIRGVGRFLSDWMNLDERWAKLVVDESGDNPRLEYYCLDASIAAAIVNEFHASVHMSGTLTPLEEYRDSLALRSPELRTFPSPFPKKNRKIIYDPTVSTRYQDLNDQMLARLEERILALCTATRHNMAVFFSSYAMLNRFLTRELRLAVDRPIYVEQQGMRQRKLMQDIESFKKKGGIFFSVIGGRISEGMDFPSQQLEMVVIVGIPYPPPTARQQALRAYYDRKFGSGWRYAVEAPTTRKMLQAVGRLIREESDRGMAVILDERAARFKKYVEVEEAEDVVQAVKDFWRE